jgi:hypothetical protein
MLLLLANLQCCTWKSSPIQIVSFGHHAQCSADNDPRAIAIFEAPAVGIKPIFKAFKLAFEQGHRHLDPNVFLLFGFIADTGLGAQFRDN